MRCRPTARRNVATLILALGLPLALSACVVRVESSDYVSRDEKRFPVTGTPDVALVTFDGPIEVRSWDRAEVLVEIEKVGAAKELVDAITVSAEQEGNRIRVEARRPESGEWLLKALVNTSRQARLVASVPRTCNLMARSGDGPIQAERLDGRIELRTGDGTVRGIELQGEVYADTGDGAVKVERIDGAAHIRTGDGAIAVSGRLREVRAETGDGSIVLTAEPGSGMTGAWDLSTGDGAVVVYLPGGFDADLDARTTDGVIRADDGLDLKPCGDAEKRSLRATLGRGGHLLRIRTADGSINLRKP